MNVDLIKCIGNFRNARRCWEEESSLISCRGKSKESSKKESVMNARNYRVNLNPTPLDFPTIMGLGESSVFYQTEVPQIINNKVLLTITMKYILLDVNINKEHEILAVQSVYEIPSNEIKSRENVYEFYNDATQSLNEAYQYERKELPTLHNIVFPNQPIENYKGEIDRVFDLLNSRN